MFESVVSGFCQDGMSRNEESLLSWLNLLIVLETLISQVILSRLIGIQNRSPKGAVNTCRGAT